MSSIVQDSAALDAAIDALPNSVTIPTLNDGTPDYVMRVRLDGAQYILRFLYNTRLDRWSFSIADSNGDDLLGATAIVANWPLTRFYKWDPRMPPGDFMAIDQTTDGSPPGFLELAPTARVRLVYFPVSPSASNIT
jgi:hypothetical protein